MDEKHAQDGEDMGRVIDLMGTLETLRKLLENALENMPHHHDDIPGHAMARAYVTVAVDQIDRAREDRA